MFDIHDLTWLDRSVRRDRAGVEAYFWRSPTFPIGDDPMDEAARLPLPGVSHLPPHESRLASSEVDGDEGPLVEYYRAVLNLARVYGQSERDAAHHFWISFEVFFGLSDVVPFFCDFGFRSVREVWDAIAGLSDADVYSDIDQGWEVLVRRRGADLHFRYGDGAGIEAGDEHGKEFANLVASRDTLLRSIDDATVRLERLVPRLTEALGTDYWTDQGTHKSPLVLR